MRHSIWFFLLLFIINSCSPAVNKMDIFDNSPLASPCLVEQDSTWIIVRDYFPKLEEKDTILISVNENTPFLTFLYIVSGNQSGTLVVKNKSEFKTKNCKRDLAPYISTERVEGRDDKLIVNIKGGVREFAILWQNTILKKKFISAEDGSRLIVTIPSNAKNMERSYIRVFAANENGIGNDILVPLNFGKVINDPKLLKRTDKHTQILYSILIDRFYNGNKENDWKLNSKDVLPKVDYWGGDIAGITQKINEGYFDTIGITTIWLSPITQNPYDAWGQNLDPKTKFTGYHGYWPIFVTQIDKRFGTDKELKNLLTTAHGDNKNVILDYVSNHMHIDSPTIKAHPDWVTSSLTPDGRPNFELWDEFRLTTWFDKHIPSLDLEKPYIYRQMTDSALFWMQNYEFDGFRHDATKHIPEVFWRMLTRKILDSIHDRQLYQIGETYGSRALISSYVKPGMLDAQFDFNVYDTFIWATTDKEGTFKKLAECIQNDLDVYGYHNLMGYISGNHDRARYVSIAGGDLIPGEDYKKAGWKRDIGVRDTIGYRKLEMLHAMNFTLPGVPCIYYGDEYGQPGGNDPDNRRWMEFEGYNVNETRVFETVKKLSSIRKSSMPLIYGDYYPLIVEDDLFVYMRVYMGEYVITALNKSSDLKTANVSLPLNLMYNGKKDMEIVVDPYSFKIYSNKK